MRGVAIETLTAEGTWNMMGTDSPAFCVSTADLIAQDRESRQTDSSGTSERGGFPAAASAASH